MVHHWYPRILEGTWRERAEAVLARTYELTGYLADVLGRTDLGAVVDESVTVHDASPVQVPMQVPVQEPSHLTEA